MRPNQYSSEKRRKELEKKKKKEEKKLRHAELRNREKEGGPDEAQGEAGEEGEAGESSAQPDGTGSD